MLNPIGSGAFQTWKCSSRQHRSVAYVPCTGVVRVRKIEELKMKSGIHPKYAPSKVICACGNTFETRSTTGEIKVEVCNQCHPFYTGKQKFLDTAGRIERFNRKYGRQDNKK